MDEFLVSPVGESVALLVALAAAVLTVWLVRRLVRGSATRSDDSESADDAVTATAVGVEQPAAQEPAPEPSLLERMSQGLAGTRERMIFRMDELFRGRREIDDDLWSDLEELLVTSDIGIGTTTRLLERLRVEADRDQLQDPLALRSLLRDQVRTLLGSRVGSLNDRVDEGPAVIVVVGVNGVGKTTTIGKLAARNVRDGRKVIVGAGDTFRAAAVEQLMVWVQRAGAELVRREEGSDPAAVTHDAVAAGVARNADLVICDTAGRLHTKGELMDEVRKIHRVAGKVCAGAPHEVLLVLDATTGQNAVMQARQFSAAVGVTGIVLTKLDGTARGGVILAIADEFDIPVKLIGIGEGVEDLRDFDPEVFVDALFGEGQGGLGRGANSAAAAAADRSPGQPVPGA